MTDGLDTDEFADKDYRHAYAEEFLDIRLATQIKVLREQRGWTQSELGARAGMTQSRISAIEDVNYSAWTIGTLKRLARAFDVRLTVKFEELGTLKADFRALSRETLQARPFEEPAP